MLIDWFTVAAQALNFMILVWLLKRFAYQPVLQAINLREQRIAAQMAAAATAKTAADAEREALARKRTELDQHRAALLDQVAQEAAALRSKLLGQARQDADAERTRLLAVLRAEQVDLERTVGRKIREVALEIVRETLRDLAQTALNETMINAFLERLRALGEADRRLLGSSGAGANAAVVRSAFELAPDTRVRIQSAVATLGIPNPEVEFETAGDLICGIELMVAGHRLAWSVSDHLESLQAGIDHILEARGRSGPAQAASMSV